MDATEVMIQYVGNVFLCALVVELLTESNEQMPSEVNEKRERLPLLA